MSDTIGPRAANLAQIREDWASRLIPEDLKGKTIMDVGCWAGGWAKIALEKGATRAIGVDVCRSPYLCDGIEFRQLDFMSEAANQLPTVDYVFLFGVLYHTYNPIGLLAQARRFAREKVFVETAYAAHRHGRVLEVMGGKDYTNLLRPSCGMVTWMMERVGLLPGEPNLVNDRRMTIVGTVGEPLEMLPREREGMMT